MKGWIFCWIVCLAVGATAEAAEHRHHHRDLEAQKASTDSLFRLGTNWTDQDGKIFRLKDLAGAPVVIAMFYTSCQAACPLLIEDMKKIQRALAPPLQGSVRFVAVSIDPKRDSSRKLKAYQEAHALAEHWTLARGDASSVRKLAAALGVQYRRESSGDFQHSFLVSVLNPAGEIAFQQNGLGHDPKPAVEAVQAAADK